MKEAKSLKDNKPFPNLDKLTETEEHGTCVASVAAGKRVGVAPKATIIPVKVWLTGMLLRNKRANGF